MVSDVAREIILLQLDNLDLLRRKEAYMERQEDRSVMTRRVVMVQRLLWGREVDKERDVKLIVGEP